MRKFKFTIEIDRNEVGEGIIEIDQKVFDIANSEEFKRYFHTFGDDDAIASHVAYHMIYHRESVNEIEGFYGALDKYAAKIVEYPRGYDDFEFLAEEIV